MNKNIVIGIAVLIVIVAGGWYWAMRAGAPAPSRALGVNGSPNQGNLGGADTGTPQAPQGDGTGLSENLVLGTNSSAALGEYLTAYNGMTLYTYAKDAPGVSNCSGTCAANWPPYTAASGDQLNLPATLTGAVATIVRADGTSQITYKGTPLYFWKNDAKPGDTTGEGVGGVWHVAAP